MTNVKGEGVAWTIEYILHVLYTNKDLFIAEGIDQGLEDAGVPKLVVGVLWEVLGRLAAATVGERSL